MKFLFVSIFCFFSSFGITQSWNEKQVEDIPSKGIKAIQPTIYRIYEIDDQNFKDQLWACPTEQQVIAGESKGKLVAFPLPTGEIDLFYIHQYNMMEEELAEKYKDFRTFKGYSRNVKGRKIRLDYTDLGVRAVITDSQGKYYIDHYQRGDKNHKIVYNRKDYSSVDKFECEFENSKTDFNVESDNPQALLLGECELKTYRYSQTATGEYSNYHGATSAAQSSLVLSAITTTINRVNDIYEQDLTVRFVLIANTDELFFYDPATDPFNGSNASNMITQNVTTTNDIIGSANYDIGHIFSTGGSGLAGLGVVCGSGKARGVTGIGTPEGDPFDIDYVAHEIGHQCGGNHTQNNSCNRSGTSVEVGSGFTIMGYAGICAPNVLNNSIAMFNVANIIEMTNFLGSQSCHATVSTGNSAPIAEFVEDKIIPISTPFVLDVDVSDPDANDVLYHTWEQQDAEVATMPPAPTNTGGPTFRAYLPSTNSARYFPRLSDLTTGTSFQWEVLPGVSREMNFIHTVRDRSEVVGCIDTASVKLTVDGSAGPFDVTSQSTAQTYTEYSNVTVTWDPGNTKNAPIGAQIVDIIYSRDGGFTYPDTLVHDARNDGSHEVVIPAGLENDARFMVKPSGNYFFDINEVDITVTNDGPSFKLFLSDYYEVTCDSGNPLSIDVSAEAYEGFTGTINLSLVNVPAGLNANLASSTITQNGSTTLDINDFTNLAGEYIIEVVATSGGVSRTAELFLNIVSGGMTSLTEPIDQQIDVENNPILKWESVISATAYEYEITNSSGSIVGNGTVTTNSVLLNNILGINQSFQWRVRPILLCGPGDYTPYYTFSTASCFNHIQRTDLIIPATASTVISTINVPFSGEVSDVNIKNLDITHSWIEDLDIRIENPANTSVLLYDNSCGDDDDILLSYDDDSSTLFDCTLRTSGNTVQPEGSLASFNTSEINGDWDLVVQDVANQDGGTVNNWTLEVCFVNDCNLIVDKIQFDDGVGSLKEAIDCAVSGDIIEFSNALGATATIDLDQENIILDKSITISVRQSQEIILVNSSNDPLIEISTGANVTFDGLSLLNTNTPNEVVKVLGTLNVENVTVESGSNGAGITNENGTLNVIGLNNLNKN